MVTRIGPDFGGGNVSVDAEAMTISIDGAVENVDVCNVIPGQRAGTNRLCRGDHRRPTGAGLGL